tara:strand:- start:2145 stop:2342 length:198 start_codon:yes stop_codon:yes gene_type:complete
MSKNEDITSWPDLAGQLYDKLTGKGSTIHYNFENFAIDVPSKVGPDAIHTKWVLNGSLNISTKNS